MNKLDYPHSNWAPPQAYDHVPVNLNNMLEFSPPLYRFDESTMRWITLSPEGTLGKFVKSAEVPDEYFYDRQQLSSLGEQLVIQPQRLNDNSVLSIAEIDEIISRDTQEINELVTKQQVQKLTEAEQLDLLIAKKQRDNLRLDRLVQSMINSENLLIGTEALPFLSSNRMALLAQSSVDVTYTLNVLIPAWPPKYEIDISHLVVPARLLDQVPPAVALRELKPAENTTAEIVKVNSLPITIPLLTDAETTPSLITDVRKPEVEKKKRGWRKWAVAAGILLAGLGIAAYAANDNDSEKMLQQATSTTVEVPENTGVTTTSVSPESTTATIEVNTATTQPPQESAPEDIPADDSDDNGSEGTAGNEDQAANSGEIADDEPSEVEEPTSTDSEEEQGSSSNQEQAATDDFVVQVGEGQGLQKVFNVTFGWSDSVSGQIISKYNDQLAKLPGTYLENGGVRISSVGDFSIPQALYQQILAEAARLQAEIPEAL